MAAICRDIIAKLSPALVFPVIKLCSIGDNLCLLFFFPATEQVEDLEVSGGATCCVAAGWTSSASRLDVRQNLERYDEKSGGRNPRCHRS
jgi:hypothetical protein